MPRFDRISTRIICFTICFAVLWLWLPAQAGATAKNNGDQFQALQKKLIEDGFNPDKIARLYSRPQVFFEADGATILFTYSEAKVDYDQFANNWSIDKAQKYMQEHRQELDRVEKTYGVDSRVITAILLVESGLGKNTGKRSTLNSLSTLASLMYPDVRRDFYKQIPAEKRPKKKKFEESAKRRSKWAYNELKAFLKYAYKEGMDPAEIPGSFAGAMGYAQFMPSNILAYGKDGNGDGAIDLLTHPDSMASIANFLKRHGWKPGISREKQEKVIYHYNHSEYYVKTILKIAERLKS
jgi:membrane-bound lytic murein transglycosylase B